MMDGSWGGEDTIHSDSNSSADHSHSHPPSVSFQIHLRLLQTRMQMMYAVLKDVEDQGEESASDNKILEVDSGSDSVVDLLSEEEEMAMKGGTSMVREVASNFSDQERRVASYFAMWMVWNVGVGEERVRGRLGLESLGRALEDLLRVVRKRNHWLLFLELLIVHWGVVDVLLLLSRLTKDLLRRRRRGRVELRKMLGVLRWRS